jgi:hypothetical protein
MKALKAYIIIQDAKMLIDKASTFCIFETPEMRASWGGGGAMGVQRAGGQNLGALRPSNHPSLMISLICKIIGSDSRTSCPDSMKNFSNIF